MEVGLPLLKNFWRRYKIRRKNKSIIGRLTSEVRLPRWEQDYTLQPMSQPVGFGDYLEMTIQYGFLTMFAAAFPIGAFFALLNNVLEVRIDAQKYLLQTKRYRPYVAQNIGPWRNILRTFTTIAVLANALILAFTTQFVDRLVFRYLVLDPPLGGVCHDYTTENFTNGFVHWKISTFNTSHYRMPAENIAELKVLDGESSERVNINMTTVELCQFIGFYQHDAHEERYVTCMEWWYVLVARLGFVILFGHLMILLQYLLAYLIPDVPQRVIQHRDRERHLYRQIFWDREKLKADDGKSKSRVTKQQHYSMLNFNTNIEPSRLQRKRNTQNKSFLEKLFGNKNTPEIVRPFSRKLAKDYVDSCPQPVAVRPPGRAKFDQDRAKRRKRATGLYRIKAKMSQLGIIC